MRLEIGLGELVHGLVVDPRIGAMPVNAGAIDGLGLSDLAGPFWRTAPSPVLPARF
jgi:hypothetical protein